MNTHLANWPPSFSLDQKKILTLLTGDRFYSNASAALREAVLNSIDAIHRRRATEPSLEPAITVEFDRDAATLTVSDNGDGMTRSTVSDLFARVGASAAAMETGRGSVGEFGIGVISYFMAGDSFILQTLSEGNQPVGLQFAREMLAGGAAQQVLATQETTGTTLIISLRNSEIFDLLLNSFSHWFRDVDGLRGTVQPNKTEIMQGGSSSQYPAESLPQPAWVERAHLRPVSDPVGWDAMSGISTVSVLYRGVFVQDFSVRGTWGIEGSIDVDPKHFKPRLNRESFVEGEFQKDVERFLRDVHPAILYVMALKLSEAVDRGDLDKWTERRWATLWLSVPRDKAYATAAEAWDKVFRHLPAFEVAVGNKWEALSLDRLLELGDPVHVAPHADEGMTEVVQAALRLLRNTGRPVIRGLKKDRTWLRYAGTSFGTTADLITSVFASELPRLILISAQAEEILTNVAAIAALYKGPPSVDMVRLGADSPPVLRLKTRLVINIDNLAGKAIVSDALDANAGRWTLIAITARHAHEQLSQVAAAVRDSAEEIEVLGLVKRRYVRELLA